MYTHMLYFMGLALLQYIMKCSSQHRW